MKLVDGKWSEPELAFFSTDKGWDFEPHISPKGDMLYFGSTRPLNPLNPPECTNGIVKETKMAGASRYH